MIFYGSLRKMSHFYKIIRQKYFTINKNDEEMFEGT